jgi:uncharacterized delta-60 repeat protein
MRALRPFAPVVAFLLIAAPAVESKPPHAGSIDRSFGKNGRVTFRLPGDRFVPRAVVVQPDSKIVMAGTLLTGATDYPGSFAGSPGAVRLLPNGALDRGFGDAGIARVSTPSPTRIQGAALQPDGAILMSGVTVPAGEGWTGAVVRLLPSGHVDAGFGSEGAARLPRAPFGTGLRDIASLTQLAVQPDGRIVAAGRRMRTTSTSQRIHTSPA